MMERYTPQAQEALGLAVGVAETLNHGYVGTEHLRHLFRQIRINQIRVCLCP